MDNSTVETVLLDTYKRGYETAYSDIRARELGKHVEATKAAQKTAADALTKLKESAQKAAQEIALGAAAAARYDSAGAAEHFSAAGVATAAAVAAQGVESAAKAAQKTAADALAKVRQVSDEASLTARAFGAGSVEAGDAMARLQAATDAARAAAQSSADELDKLEAQKAAAPSLTELRARARRLLADAMRRVDDTEYVHNAIDLADAVARLPLTADEFIRAPFDPHFDPRDSDITAWVAKQREGKRF